MTDRTAPADPRESLARVFAGPKDDLGLGCSESVGKSDPPHGVRYSPCGRPAHAYAAPNYDLDNPRPGALCKLHTTLVLKRGGRLDRLVTDDDRRAAEQSRYDRAYRIALSRADYDLDAIREAGYALAARQDEPSPALRDRLLKALDDVPTHRQKVEIGDDGKPAKIGPKIRRDPAFVRADCVAAVEKVLAANPPQTREARHTIGCECPCHLRTGVPCRDCLGQTREAEGAAPDGD